MSVLVPAVGNMYKFVSHEWRPITGKCSHGCTYCYVTSITKKYGRKQRPIHLSTHSFKDLGEKNFIFVCSTCDLFAKDIPEEWIYKVLAQCVKYNKNKYLFQTKNPEILYKYKDYIPEGSYIATTVETNRHYEEMGNAPPVKERLRYMGYLKEVRDFKTLITIEPILDFDIQELVYFIEKAHPNWVNIGADSKGNKLPEPNKAKILDLILRLRKITEVKIKDNLKRIIRE